MILVHVTWVPKEIRKTYGGHAKSAIFNADNYHDSLSEVGYSSAQTD